MKRIIQLTLPWPHSALSPNARVNLMQKARIFKREKYATMMLTKAALQKVGIEKVTVKGGLPDKKWRGGRVNIELICIPPVTRYHDEDNLLANCKAILDGIAEGMQVNDNTFHFKEQDWLQAENPGHLIINITWEPSLGCRSLGGRDHE